ncbi:MAG: hypothetical protein XD49_1648 [Caldanaerobacter subterraneus]|uniref:Uncharacterized protein n=1 Tax=Caldanaerobacter subterraneus TaxID=911092 RepID=A0A101E4S2_9THEO|nr:MAG: hypothetical protein XD49_1648 [Caldanaerobacter subterraneus]MDK2794192.1 hypothetical protein [Caldanaerobacter sp.]TCO61512.1 hypothetical protein EV203_11929 [Caldanaerobacter subterraneus]
MKFEYRIIVNKKVLKELENTIEKLSRELLKL